MAVKLSVGLQKKLGLPGYSSIGASCHVEFEVDHSMIETNLDGFHGKVHAVFAACQHAVNEQLARQQSKKPASNIEHQVHEQVDTQSEAHRRQPAKEIRKATQGQLRTIAAIARAQRLDLPRLIHERFNLDLPEELTIRDASSLIDGLKRGEIEVRP